MNYLFELAHPKHYYQFRLVIQTLHKNPSNNLLIIARDKDVLLKVLKEDGIPFIVYGKHGKSIFSKFFVLPTLFHSYFKIIRKNKIDVVISKASPYAALLGIILDLKTIITPDSEIVTITKKLVAPLATSIITPNNYSLDYGEKHKRFSGFFEDCYLHPDVFSPNKELVKKLGFSLKRPFFILRFISWNANHDINNYGFTSKEKIAIVNKLVRFGDVYISSEGVLPREIEKYRITIPHSKIHHVLHFASMYIGDSQSMATESALLGTPSIRYNSFVGENDMTNFILLEKKYKLLKNFNKFSLMILCVDKFLSSSNNKNEWLKKRKKYYNEIGNVNYEIQSIIENVS